VSELVNVYPGGNVIGEYTRVDEDEFNEQGHGNFINGEGLTVLEWIDSLPRLTTAYGAPETDNTQTSFTQGGNIIRINNGQCLFTGHGTILALTAAENRTMALLDWIRLNMKVAGAWLKTENGGLEISNKLGIYYTDYTPFPSDLISQPKMKTNYRAGGDYKPDLSIFLNAEVLSEAIGNYIGAMMKNDLRFETEIVLNGRQEAVNVRYMYDDFMLYVIGAEYDIERDETRLTCLARLLGSRSTEDPVDPEPPEEPPAPTTTLEFNIVDGQSEMTAGVLRNLTFAEMTFAGLQEGDSLIDDAALSFIYFGGDYWEPEPVLTEGNLVYMTGSPDGLRTLTYLTNPA
jgi:hypothetical protein